MTSAVGRTVPTTAFHVRYCAGHACLWGVVAIVVAIMTTLLTVSGPAAHADTPAITLDVKLDLNADGVLAVTTTATVPQGASAVGTVPFRFPWRPTGPSTSPCPTSPPTAGVGRRPG